MDHDYNNLHHSCNHNHQANKNLDCLNRIISNHFHRFYSTFYVLQILDFLLKIKAGSEERFRFND